MAWNPSPEVRVARDTADAMHGVTGTGIDVCIVTWLDDRSRFGYASYGRTPGLCGMARRIADAMHAEIRDPDKFGAMLGAIERSHKSASGGAGIDFDKIETEVLLKLRLLKASLAAEFDPDIRRAYVRDLVMPAAELLARFCACVNVEPPT